MRTLPTMMLHLLNPFVPLFSRRVVTHVQVLLAGAFPQLRAKEPLVPHYVSWAWGKPSSSSATTVSLGPRRLVGQGGEPCAAELAREDVRTQSGPLVLGVDETLERRWGKKIAYTRGSTAT
jgi:hypothetical protein